MHSKFKNASKHSFTAFFFPLLLCWPLMTLLLASCFLTIPFAPCALGFEAASGSEKVLPVHKAAKESLLESRQRVSNLGAHAGLSRYSQSPLDQSNVQATASPPGSCDLDSCGDKHGYEAIRWLHRQLDDDANGNVDISESDEFLRDELQYENGHERQKVFHGNDKHISVDEFWRYWTMSEVHNWTVEQTVEWLVSSVELPQYVETFINHEVTGAMLPRLASSSQFATSQLGIKDPIHRQKLSLKSMDVVLFGPPKQHNYVKDVVLVLSLVLAVGGCWFAYVQHKYSKNHEKKMLEDMDSLRLYEEKLSGMQQQLEDAKHAKQTALSEKYNMEKRLQEEREQLSNSRETSLIGDDSRLYELEQELRETREQLTRAETALTNRSWAPPPSLQQWLQLTHELEIRHYNIKRKAAEDQLTSAKDGCEKLRKKRATLFGSFRVAHGSSIDDVDNRIMQAKTALHEVTRDLQERMHRWRQIELLCGFQVVNNKGLNHLHHILLGGSVLSLSSSSQASQPSLTRNNSEGTLVDPDEIINGVSNSPLGKQQTSI